MDPVTNAEAPWGDFDSEDYFAHNYRSVREDDRLIVAMVRDFFAEACANSANLRGIDVGTGPNLYPALAMLPFSATVDLYERSPQNVAWLTAGRDTEWAAVADSVQAFWDLYAQNPVYRDSAVHDDPRLVLAMRARVVKGSVFDLDPNPGERYDVGTMFFVAESLSADPREFDEAVRRFLGGLRPGAPFAAAFMEGSCGYDVGGFSFPATAVTADDVRSVLAGHGARARLESVAIPSGGALRPGYDGMLVALGRTAGTVT